MNTDPYHNIDIDQYIERIPNLYELNFGNVTFAFVSGDYNSPIR
jgi:hypothetical protein